RLIEPRSSRWRSRLINIRPRRFFSFADHRGGRRQGNPIDAGWRIFLNRRADGVAVEGLIGGSSQKPPRPRQECKIVRDRDSNLIPPADLGRFEMAVGVEWLQIPER